MKNDIDFSVIELLIAKKVLLEISFDDVKKEEQPLAIILGGQPASGKTELFRHIQNNIYTDKKIVYINGDEYRALHPRNDEIAIKYGTDYAEKTQYFANSLVVFMKEECIKRRYNFILESTFRNLEPIRDSSEDLKKEKYQTAVYALSVSYWDSLLGIFERYEGQIKDTDLGRFSSLNTHEEAFNALPKNLKICYQENLFDEIVIYKRNFANLEGIKINSISEIDNQMKHRLPISNLSFYKNKFQNILEIAYARECIDSNYLNQINSIIQKLQNLEM